MIQCQNNSASAISTPLFEDNEIELARQMQQSDLLTCYEGGIIPERVSLTGISSMLDAACGPGGWALEAAKHLPDIRIVGVDNSKRMVAYAKARAARMGFTNLQFAQMDITAPLQFSDNAFDLVNARCVQGVLGKTTWLTFLSECWRLLRPGGVLRLTEEVYTESNSTEFNQIIALLHLALYRAGYSFTPGPHSAGLVFMLASFLRSQGFHTLSSHGWIVDCSFGADRYAEILQHIRISFSPYVLGTFLTKTGVTTINDYERLYERAMASVGSSTFQGFASFLTITGECSK